MRECRGERHQKLRRVAARGLKAVKRKEANPKRQNEEPKRETRKSESRGRRGSEQGWDLANWDKGHAGYNFPPVWC